VGINTQPQLADGYGWDIIPSRSGVELPVIVPLDTNDRRWWVQHMAPSECFADPAPAPDAPLKEGDSVWVDCPSTLWCGVGPRPLGCARVRQPPGLSEWVHLEMVTGRRVRVPTAACHREGPQEPPPAESATFLGRRNTPDGPDDFWWSCGTVCRNEGALGWGAPKHIDGPNISPDLQRPYRDALAVARKFGLVQAEAEAEEPAEKPTADAVWIGAFKTPADYKTPAGWKGAWWLPGARAIKIHRCAWPVETIDADDSTIAPNWQPCYQGALAKARKRGLIPEPEAVAEPKRPEPKFVMGQVVEWGTPKNLVVMRITSKPDWHLKDQCWVYSVETFAGFATVYAEIAGTDGSLSLRPHAITIADLTDDQRRMLPGDEVRVVDLPVNHAGRPDKIMSDNDFAGKRFTIRSIESDPNGIVAWGKTSDGQGLALWLWNLALATPGDTEQDAEGRDGCGAED